MGISAIEWTYYVFNPWIGCTKVSAGCKHCYAETLMDKRYGRVKWGPAGVRKRTSEANWKKPLTWDRKAKAAGERRKVFCASLADVFEDRPELVEWRDDLFDLIHITPHLVWLLLTKRPENVIRMMDGYDFNKSIFHLHNIWIGTSVEDQETADERIPHLLQIPAKIRFLSCEPLLGPVDLWRFGDDEMGFATQWDHRGTYPFYQALGWEGSKTIRPGIDWVIAGGESGPNARPMHPAWARSLRDQCQAAGVPFFFKQWGKWVPSSHLLPHMKQDRVAWPWAEKKGDDLTGDTTMMIPAGKKAAGRLLDGRAWSEFPEG